MMRHATCMLAAFALFTGPSSAADSSGAAQLRTSLDKAKIRLVTAVDTALREVDDAQFLSAELQPSHDGLVYEVHLRTGDTLKRLIISAMTGEVAKIEDAVPGPEQAAEWEAIARASEAVHISPLQALEAAAGEYKDGRVYGFGLDVEGAAPMYKVDMVSGGRIVEAGIDAATGAVREETRGEPAKAPVATDARVWNFDKDEPGKAPAGWTFGETGTPKPEGEWKVATDASAVSKPHVFSLTKGSSVDGQYSVAMIDGTDYLHMDLSAKVRANTGKVDQGGGLVWRCKNAENYYICRFNPLESNYRVYKVVDGKRSQLASAKVETVAGKWYKVRAVMIGPKITCWLDDQKLLEAEDDAIQVGGRIGVWTKADACTSFDDLTVSEPMVEAPKPVAPPPAPPSPPAPKPGS